MKCQDLEQEIYGYRELTASEKKVVDAHVLNCESCRELLTVVQQTTGLISHAASIKPQPENFSRLTGNIMQGLDKEQNQSTSWLNSLFLRYAMIAASLILVVGFVTEQHSSAELPHTPTIAGAVILQSQPVSTIRNQKKEKTISLYACAKSGDCNNTLFQTLKQRF